MMIKKIKMGNDLLFGIQEFLEEIGVEEAHSKAHSIMHIIANNEVE